MAKKTTRPVCLRTVSVALCPTQTSPGSVSRGGRGPCASSAALTCPFPLPVSARSILVTIPADRKRELKFEQVRARPATRTTNSVVNSALIPVRRTRMTRWLAGLRNGLKSCVRAQSSVASSPRAASPHQGDTQRINQIVAARRATAESWSSRHLHDISSMAWRRGLSPFDSAGAAAFSPRTLDRSPSTRRRLDGVHPTHRLMRAQVTSSTTAAPG